MADQIGSAQLIDFETARRTEGVVPPTIRRDLACLSSLYGFLIEREIVEVNPVPAFLKRAKRRGLREAESRTRYLSKKEEPALIAAAVPSRRPPAARKLQRPSSGPRNDMMLRAAIIVAIHTGLRLREQFDLVWDDVDLESRLIHIPADRAKGRKSRSVVIFEPAIIALRSLPRHIRSRRVFWHRNGQKFLHLDRGFKAAARRAKTKNVRWHDLRRTHGCRLLQEHGWSLEMVQAQLGHASIVTTQKAYAFLEVEQRLNRADNCAAGNDGASQPQSRAVENS